MSFEYKNDPEPETPEVRLTPEEFLAQRKLSIRKRSFWFGGIGLFIVLVFLFWMLILRLSLDDVLTSGVGIFFILGMFFGAAGLWGIYEERRMTVADIMPTDEAIEFSRSLVQVTPYYSQLMIGGFIFVFLAQIFGPHDPDSGMAAMRASLLKPDTLERGEYWRLLTATVMHGGIMHIFFNSYAAFSLGSLIETISNRAHLAVVFILSAITGSIFSSIFMPQGESVGASGGILGFIGYLAVYGYRRKRQLPSDFLRSMIVNILLIAGIGILGSSKIDNSAHLGGLLAGAIYGFIQIPRSYREDPRITGLPMRILGYACMAIFAATCVLAILLLLEKISF